MEDWLRGWATGLIDGEGSFNINIWKNDNAKIGIVIRPEFSLSLHVDDKNTLEKFKDILGVGKIYRFRGNSLEYKVLNIDECFKLIEFFESNRLFTTKNKNFKIWKECVLKVKNYEYKSKEDIVKLTELRDKNKAKKGKRVITSTQIIEWFDNHKPIIKTCKICSKVLRSPKGFNDHMKKHGVGNI